MFKYLLLISLMTVLLSIYFVDYNIITPIYNLFNKSNNSSNEKLFQYSELKLYNGVDRPQLYLSILGNIFDVTKGEKFYGPEGTYNYFIAKDASKNFITGYSGDSDILSDDVTGLNAEELLSLNKWLQFYRAEYTFKGKLIGKYYDTYGTLTPYAREIQKLIKKAKLAKQNQSIENEKYPPCNVEWDAVKGTKVWCTNRSGGIQRDWIGTPRQYFEIESQNHRCACIKKEDLSLQNIREYKNCNQNADTCFISE